MNDSEKLDRVLKLVELLVGDLLPAGWYDATLLKKERQESIRTGRSFSYETYRLELLPDRVMEARFFDHVKFKPQAEEREVSDSVQIKVEISTFNNQRRNFVTDVRYPDS